MDTKSSFDLEEFKKRLSVLRTSPAKASVDDFADLESALKAEVNELVDMVGVHHPEHGFGINPHNVPTTKARMIVRSMFAEVEAAVYGMKQLALSASKDEQLSLEEQIVCAELSVGLKNNGEAQASPMRLQFVPNVRFAFSILAKALRVSFALDANSTGWNRFNQAVKIRNRLTHPKRPTDLDLTADEIGYVFEAYAWFQDQVGTLLATWGTEVEKTNAMLAELNRRATAAVDARSSSSGEVAGSDSPQRDSGRSAQD